MENKFDYIAEAMLPSVINLIPNSAKVYKFLCFSHIFCANGYVNLLLFELCNLSH